MGRNDCQVGKPEIVSMAHFFLWILLVTFVGKDYLLPALTAGMSFGFTSTHNSIVMIDFASHFNFAKSVWLSETIHDSVNSAYSVANHLFVTGNWGRTESPSACPPDISLFSGLEEEPEYHRIHTVYTFTAPPLLLTSFRSVLYEYSFRFVHCKSLSYIADHV